MLWASHFWLKGGSRQSVANRVRELDKISTHTGIEVIQIEAGSNTNEFGLAITTHNIERPTDAIQAGRREPSKLPEPLDDTDLGVRDALEAESHILAADSGQTAE